VSSAAGTSATPAVIVLAAMATEVRPLVRALGLAPSTSDGHRSWTGSVKGERVVVATIGIGPERAERSTSRILGAEAARRVIVAGVSGAVDPALGVADLLVPRAVVDQASGRLYQPQPSATAPRGTLLTCDALVTGSDTAAALGASGISAVDMETAAVAAVCDRKGIPWSVYRSMSDRVADGILDATMITLLRADGRIDPLAAARMAARRPGTLRRLARLGMDTRAAVASLTRAVHDDISGMLSE
jgi:nucleoside phosphorylase